MTAVDDQRTRTYGSPECRTAAYAEWDEGHDLCAGNTDVSAAGHIVERLHCGCICHELPPRPPTPCQSSDRDGPPPIQQDGGTTMRTTDTRPSTPPGRRP